MYSARCAAHVRLIDDMCNRHFDALQRSNRAVPDMGSVSKNTVICRRPAQHSLLSVVVFLGGYPVYVKGAKDDWDFRISDLVENTDGTDI